MQRLGFSFCLCHGLFCFIFQGQGSLSALLGCQCPQLSACIHPSGVSGMGQTMKPTEVYLHVSCSAISFRAITFGKGVQLTAGSIPMSAGHVSAVFCGWPEPRPSSQKRMEWSSVTVTTAKRRPQSLIQTVWKAPLSQFHWLAEIC